MTMILLFGLILAPFLNDVNGAVMMAQAEVGKPYVLPLGAGNFVVKRTIRGQSPQYLFASPNQDGSWTTNGVDRIPSSAHLYFNGTLVFNKVAESDIGSYELPLEKIGPKVGADGSVSMVAGTMINLQGIPQMPPSPGMEPPRPEIGIQDPKPAKGNQRKQKGVACKNKQLRSRRFAHLRSNL